METVTLYCSDDDWRDCSQDELCMNGRYCGNNMSSDVCIPVKLAVWRVAQPWCDIGRWPGWEWPQTARGTQSWWCAEAGRPAVSLAPALTTAELTPSASPIAPESLSNQRHLPPPPVHNHHPHYQRQCWPPPPLQEIWSHVVSKYYQLLLSFLQSSETFLIKAHPTVGQILKLKH